MIYVTYAMPEEAPTAALPSHATAVQTGIGKVLAVTMLSREVVKHPADLVISVGFCGGINGTAQGEVVLANETRQWDLYLEAPIPLGHGYDMHCPMRLQEVELNSLPAPVRGRMLTGDRFVDRTVLVSKHAVAVDMETAALAVFCHELSIPFVSVREVSDVADGPQGMPHQQFIEYIKQKGPAYTEAVLELIERGPEGIAAPRKIRE